MRLLFQKKCNIMYNYTKYSICYKMGVDLVIVYTLRKNNFYLELEKRRQSDDVANAFCGILPLVESDVQSGLEYIKAIFPSYTDHGIQHSLRILTYIYEVIGHHAIDNLSSTEIFCLIMAALFHDMGMIKPEIEDKESVRTKHHFYALVPLREYFKTKLTIIGNNDRYVECIGFICEAHGLSLDEFYNHKSYKRTDRINNQIVRFNLLAVMLRVGDLLDFEEERTNEFNTRVFSAFFQDINSQEHHERHRKVNQFDYSDKEIIIVVESPTRTQHIIWSTWFQYLKDDILHANTYIFSDEKNRYFHFPPIKSEIVKSLNATYEVEELRFEIDDKGKIWDVVSKSIYTSKFDFLRELIQNAIDANLMTIYQDKNLTLQHSSPRSWSPTKYQPKVLIMFSKETNQLAVVDNGIGMTKSELQKFLFKVADSGYSSATDTREFPFPSIAKFGIGFISTLIKATNIYVITKKRQYDTLTESECFKISISSKSSFAFIECGESLCDFGTFVLLELKEKYDVNDITDYIHDTFSYTSVPVTFIDVDKFERLVNFLEEKEGISQYSSKVFRNSHRIGMILKTVDTINDSKVKIQKEYAKTFHVIEEAVKYISEWKYKARITYSSLVNFKKEFYIDLLKIYPEIHQNIDIIERNLGLVNISKNNAAIEEYNKVIFSNLDIINKVLLEVRRNLNSEANPLYDDFITGVKTNKFTDKFDFSTCIILLDYKLQIKNVIFDCEIIPKDSLGIIIINSSFIDNDNGIEWVSLNAFLFNRGIITNSLARIVGLDYDFIESSNSHGVYGDIENELEDDFYESEMITGNPTTEVIFATTSEILKIDKLEIERATEACDLYYTYFRKGEYLNDRNITNIILSEKTDYPNNYNEFDNNVITNLSILRTNLSELKNQAYQDGIKLSIMPNYVTPFGMCYATVNLTSKARFDLNVTRNTIDETESKVSYWTNNIGYLIQKRVLKNITNKFNEYHLWYKLDDMLVYDKNNILPLLKSSLNTIREKILKEY